MKIIKTIGLVLLAIIALALIVGAILPTHFEYERTAEINAPKGIIFEKINDLKTWEDWGPWKAEDPTMDITFGDVSEGLGASYSWTGEKSGKGKLTVVESTPPIYQKSKLEFDGEDGGFGWFKVADGENGANATTWGFSIDIPYPFNSMMLLTGGSMEKQMNKMFDTGLGNLKEVSEKIAAEQMAGGYTIKPMDFPGKSYLAIRQTVKMKDMTAFYGNSFGQIMGAIGTGKLEMDGMPCGIFYSWDEESGKTDMAAAIPVKAGAGAAAEGIQELDIPKGKCLTIDYYGDYHGIGKAHEAMDEYLKKTGTEPSTLVMEEYLTDPVSEPDTAKWLTKVYYFVDGPLASEK